MPTPERSEAISNDNRFKSEVSVEKLCSEKDRADFLKPICKHYDQMLACEVDANLMGYSTAKGSLLQEMARSPAISRPSTTEYLQRAKKEAASLMYSKPHFFERCDETIGEAIGSTVGKVGGALFGGLISGAQGSESSAVANHIVEGCSRGLAIPLSDAGRWIGNKVGRCADKSLSWGIGLFSTSQKAGNVLMRGVEEAEKMLHKKV